MASTSTNGSESEKDLNKRVMIAGFIIYVVSNAYPKIAARIINGSLTWKKDPIEFIADYDVRKISISAGKTLCVRREDIIKYLLRSGVPPGRPAAKGSGTIFDVTRDTIEAWIRALTTCWAKLKKRLVTKYNQCQSGLTAKDLAYAATYLVYFHGLLETGLVELLLEDANLAKEIKVKKSDAESRKRSRLPCLQIRL